MSQSAPPACRASASSAHRPLPSPGQAQTPAGEPLVSLEDVCFAYEAGAPVLRGVNLRLHAGERVGLIGPNGAGKTTLLHLVVGLLRPTAGVVRAFGRPRSSESDFLEVRARAGLMFQRPDDQLFCPTVLEDVTFGPLNLGKSRREATEIASRTMDALHLRGYEDRVTHHLSEGEKRRVCLAAILAMEPEVLLLDEPVSGLDPENRELVRDLLLHLPQAMLIVAHERDFLADVTSRVVELHPPAGTPRAGEIPVEPAQSASRRPPLPPRS